MQLVDPRGAGTMRRFLVTGERMVVVHRPHIASLFGTFFALFAGVVITLFVGFTAPASLGFLTNAMWYVLFAMAVYTAISVWLWTRDWFVATNRRLVWRRGILNQKTAMMPLTKVTDMSFNQPAVGRILGYGEFVMESAGQEQALRVISYIPHPEASYRAICGELFGHHDVPAPPMVPTTDVTFEDRTDDTDPFLRPAAFAEVPRPVPHTSEHSSQQDAAGRLGSYLDRHRDHAQTPLRQRLLRGPQPTEQTPDHEDAWDLSHAAAEDDSPWSVSREDASPTHRVDRSRN